MAATKRKMKTVARAASPIAFIDKVENDVKRKDSHELVAMMQDVTGEPPKMWGPSIVGFGSYRYTYDSGHSGEAPLAGFAIRGRELVLYVSCDDDAQASLLAKVGPHKMGKSCLYFKRLADLDRPVLERLVAGSIAATKRRHG